MIALGFGYTSPALAGAALYDEAGRQVGETLEELGVADWQTRSGRPYKNKIVATLEGYLFPDTYFFTPGTTARTAVATNIAKTNASAPQAAP